MKAVWLLFRAAVCIIHCYGEISGKMGKYVAIGNGLSLPVPVYMYSGNASCIYHDSIYTHIFFFLGYFSKLFIHSSSSL